MRHLFSLLFGMGVLFQIAHAQINLVFEGSPCVGSQLTFYEELGLSASDYSWDFGNGDTSSTPDSAKYTYTEAGDYTVTLTLISGGSTFTSSKVVTIYENPECEFSVDSVPFSSYTKIFQDESISEFTLSSFLWDFGDGEELTIDTAIIEYRYSAAGDYEVWLWSTDVNGCTDSASQIIEVNNIYRVPNVFTPNGDGINDQFIVTVNGYELFSIEIYSRWGNLVFRRENVNNLIWDGRMPDGSKVKPGTYFYVITAHDSQFTYDPESGYITVFYEKDE